MEKLSGVALMREPKDMVLWRSGRDYYAAGQKVYRLSGGNWAEPPEVQVYDEELAKLLQGRRPGRRPDWLRRASQDTVELVRDANAIGVAQLEEEAIVFLRQVRAQYPDLPMVVSWSGGKDSTAASVLTRRAFPGERVIHVFADTTIELPSTYEYLEAFRAANPGAAFLVGFPTRDFFDLCREIGPPSTIQRWCCTSHKAVPLTGVLRTVGDGGPVLSVAGLRRSESRRRQHYRRVIDNGKIGLQVLASPLADWTDFDVWVWSLVNRVPLNEGYRHGMDRIGCAFCPDSGDWSNMIGGAVFGNYYEPWLHLLCGVAKRAGVEAPEQYVTSGAWKSRRGGGIGRLWLPRTHTYDIATRPCEVDERAVTYDLSQAFEIRTLREILKPFGRVTGGDNESELAHMVVTGPHGAFGLDAFPHWRRIRVTFDLGRTRHRLEGTLRAQFRKLQACVGCGGCAATCPRGAITRVGTKYTIEEGLCTHCLQCIRAVKAGCWAAHSLNVSQVRAHA